jgi:hypothetical protein
MSTHVSEEQLHHNLLLAPTTTNYTPAHLVWHPSSMLNKIDRILIASRYTFFSRSPTINNSRIKHAWPGAILGWMTDRDVFSVYTCEEKSVQKRLV